MNFEAGRVLTFSISFWAILPVIAVHIPLVGAALLIMFRKREKVRNALALGAALLTTITIASMYEPVIGGVRIGKHVYKSLEFIVPVLLRPGIGFRVDTTSFIFAIITAFIWTIALIYSLSYMENERARTSYYVFSMLTLTANLGVVLTKDFFSLYLFFEALAFFSYMLFIHRRDKQSLAAGKLYLYLSIAGGLCLLMGFLLLYHFTGTMNIEPIGRLLSKAIPQHIKFTIFALMIIGFGVKAGIFFLHVWMPETYPVALAPVCAMSSGAMIKAGAYGILRTVNTLFAPFAILAASRFTLSSIGYVVIIIGIITMLGGMINALLSKDCKRLLAYSSVSQMGFIVLGLGVAAYMGREGAMAMAGSLYHIVNHAFLKSALFLTIGVVYFRTNQLDMDKLGGLWRNMPLTALVCFIAVLGISGIPGFGGFASKAILHEAVVAASAHSTALSPLPRPDILLRIAEIVFVVTAAGTLCYSLKLFSSVFLSRRPEKLEQIKAETIPMKIALLPLAILILGIGLKPNLLLEKLIGPALASFGFDPTAHSYQLLYNVKTASGVIRSSIPILYDPSTLSILGSPQVLHNLLIVGIEIICGGLLFVLGYRFGLFKVEAPEWTGTKYWYIKTADGFLELIQFINVIKKKISHLSLRFVGSQTIGQQEKWLLKQMQIKEMLENEKISRVKEAVRSANISMKKNGIATAIKGKKVIEIREDAGRKSARILKLKKSIMGQAIQTLEKAEIPINKRSYELSEIMGPIAKVAENSGYGGLESLQEAIEDLNRDLELSREPKKGSILLDIVGGGQLKKRMAERAETKEKWEALVEKYRIIQFEQLKSTKRLNERIAQWTVNMLRILAEIFAGERLPWQFEESLTVDQINQTKNSIRTYTRDIDLNMMVLLGLFVVIALVLLVEIFLNA